MPEGSDWFWAPLGAGITAYGALKMPGCETLRARRLPDAPAELKITARLRQRVGLAIGRLIGVS